MSTFVLCPCSGKEFAHCCKSFLDFEKAAPTAESLMRSRYTAYALANIDYLEKTLHGPAVHHFNRQKTRQFAKENTWLGLEIIDSYQSSDTIAYVEFVAHYKNNLHSGNKHQHLHELSEFHFIDDQWYYVTGTHKITHPCSLQPRIKEPKMGRNDPCLCGSEKKFKKCCG